MSFAAYLGDKDEFAKCAQENQCSGVDDVKGQDFGARAGDGCNHEDLREVLRFFNAGSMDVRVWDRQGWR